MCRTWPAGLGAPRARAPGVTIDDLYDAMAKRIPENGPTVRRA